MLTPRYLPGAENLEGGFINDFLGSFSLKYADKVTINDIKRAAEKPAQTFTDREAGKSNNKDSGWCAVI